MITTKFMHSCEQIESRIGFCDLDLIDKMQKVPEMLKLGEELFEKGFRYAGDTKSDSKACTDVIKKRIFIGRNKTANEACLSLAYEMINAKNSLRLQNVQAEFLSDTKPSKERGELYARKILEIESEAIFFRSIVALKTDLRSSIKNQNYLRIVEEEEKSSACIPKIFKEMLENGTVHNGKKKALDHYVSQYFEYSGCGA